MIFGCAGSGKSTLARQLATSAGLPLIERDGLGPLGSREYRAAAETLTARQSWVFDGAPYYVEDIVYAAADSVIILDYPKWIVMVRVLRRTLATELFRRNIGAHHRQGRAAWRDSSHPMLWAWKSHGDRHNEGLRLVTRPDLARSEIIHFTRPTAARRWIRELAPRSGVRWRIPPTSTSAVIGEGRHRRVDIVEWPAEDVDLLETHLPSPGLSRRHEMRFDRLQRGLSTFLVAWSADIPVGVGEIRWLGCAAPEVIQAHPGCPELNGLHVRPARRSEGIGARASCTRPKLEPADAAMSNSVSVSTIRTIAPRSSTFGSATQRPVADTSTATITATTTGCGTRSPTPHAS